MYEYKPEQFIEVTIICDKCHKTIKWRYNIPLKEYGMYTGSYSTDVMFASKLVKHDNNDHIYCVRYKNCDKKNYFEYIME